MVQFGSGNGVELRSIMTPNVNVAPGQSFEVVFDLYNHSSVIIGDPDGCSRANTPCEGKDGYCLRVKAQAGDSSQEAIGCLNLPETGIPPNNEQWSVTLPAPDQPGQYTVTGTAEATNSGNQSGSVSSTVTVAEQRDDVDDGSGNGNNDDKNPKNNNGNIVAYVLNNPGKAAIVGGGAAFMIDRTLNYTLDQ